MCLVLANRKVLVLCNLKPRKMGTFVSNGMVLCASNEDKTKVEIIDPPIGAVIGERVTFPSIPGFDSFVPYVPNKVAKQKVFEKTAPGLITNAAREPCWVDAEGKEHVFITSAGSCTASSIAKGKVS